MEILKKANIDEHKKVSELTVDEEKISVTVIQHEYTVEGSHCALRQP
jgi:ribosomal protein S13